MSIWSRRTSKGDQGTWDAPWKRPPAAPSLGQEHPLSSMGLGAIPLQGWQDQALPSGALQSPSAEGHPCSPAPGSCSQPPSPLQPPHSPVAPHPVRALSSTGAAGALGPALPEAVLCPEGTKGEAGGPWQGQGFGWWLTASLSPEPGAVLPRRGLRAAAGDPPQCNLPGMEMGMGTPRGFLREAGMPGRTSPGCGPVHGLGRHLSPSPQTLETHLALCSATSRKLIQKYFSNRIQQQVGVWMVLPAPSHIPPLLIGPACGNVEFPHYPPRPGAVGAGFASALSRRGLNASQRIPAHPGTPKFLPSLCPTLCTPSMMGIKHNIFILVSHCPAGHELGEIRGCDHQSSVPAFGAETPRGSAQRHQPHPAGLQRWVWVGRGATLPQGLLSLSLACPSQERCWQCLDSLMICFVIQGGGFGGKGGLLCWFWVVQWDAAGRTKQCSHPTACGTSQQPGQAAFLHHAKQWQIKNQTG